MADTHTGLEQAELEKLVDARTRELSRFSTHLQELAEAEKAELARRLHDELGGLLTAAKMDLSWLQSRMEVAAMQERLAQLGSVLDEAMDLKRRVVEELRPSLLDHFGLPTALRAHLDTSCAKAGLKVEVTVPDDGLSMPRSTAIALFRVIQEGLTNVIRHAQASSVKLLVTSESEAEACLLVLSDDGCGFDIQALGPDALHGITGMRQRVHALGGKLTVESTPGNGTRLHVEIPRSALEFESEPLA